MHIAEQKATYAVFTPEELSKEIVRLEEQMYKYAQDLEFEKASETRDKVAKLREQLIQ
ncbi:UvrB/UvrC motif-containing protein [Moritella viscosa]